MKLIICLLLIGLFMYRDTRAQTHYYFSGSGALHQLTSWGTGFDGSANQPASFNQAADTFEIRNASWVALSGNWSVSGKVICGDGTHAITLQIPTNCVCVAAITVSSRATLELFQLTLPTLDSLFTGSKVIYAGNGNQALTSHSYSDLEISGSGNKSATGDLMVRGTLVVNGTLQLNGSTEDLSGTFGEVAGSGWIKTASAGSTPIPAQVVWHPTVEFYRSGTGTQTVPAGHYNKLLITGGTGSRNVVDGNLAIDSLLYLAPDTKLAMNGWNLTGKLDSMAGTGNLSTLSTDSLPVPLNRVWPFTVTYAGSSTGQTIVAGTYASLAITSGSDVNRANGDIRLSDQAQLQISSGNVLDMQEFNLRAGSGMMDGGAGTIRTQSVADIPLEPHQTWSQTISYNGSRLQHVVAGNYQALSVNGGDRIFPEQDTLFIRGNFTATSPVSYATTSTVFVFNGASQTVNAQTAFQFATLVFSGSGTKTIGSTLSVSTRLGIEDQVMVYLGSNSLNGTGFATTGSCRGLLRTTAVGTAALPPDINWRFRVQYDGNQQTISKGDYLGGLNLLGNNKVLNGNTNVGDTLTIYTGTRLLLNEARLSLYGLINPSQQGVFSGGGQSEITVMPGTTNAGQLWMDQTTRSTSTLRQFTVNREGVSQAIELGNSLYLSGMLNLIGGNLHTNDHLIFTSMASDSSAQIAPVGLHASLTGAVTVERFLKGRPKDQASRWRFVTAPVQATQTLAQTWQQQVHITGNGNGGSACPDPFPNSNGFDVTPANNPSCYTWDALTQQWEKLQATTGTTCSPGKAFRLFFRGARSQGCALLNTDPPDPHDTVLVSKGYLLTGTVSIGGGIQPGDYVLIGNPYQATVDWTSPDLTKQNLLPVMYGWKPDASTNGTYASYITFPVHDSTHGMTRFVAPGSAFFVQTESAGGGQVTFREEAKATDKPGSAFFKTAVGSVSSPALRVKLFRDEHHNALDEVLFRVVEGTSPGYDRREDVLRMSSSEAELAIQTSNGEQAFTICRVPALVGSEVFRIRLFMKPIPQSYRLEFAEVNSFPDSITLILADTYLNREIDLSAQPEYRFQTSTNPLSVDKDRFRVYWRKRQDIPLHTAEVNIDTRGSLFFPQPFNHTLSFRMPVPTNMPLELGVLDINGECVYKRVWSGERTVEIELNTAEWIPGVYVATVRSGEWSCRASLLKY